MTKQAELDLNLHREVDSFLKQQLHKQLLRYAAGTAISCPGCGDIMDCRRTVSAEIVVDYSDGRPEAIVRTYTLCAKCWDKYAPNVQHGIDKAMAKNASIKGRVDVVDGRQVFEDEADEA